MCIAMAAEKCQKDIKPSHVFSCGGSGNVDEQSESFDRDVGELCVQYE